MTAGSPLTIDVASAIVHYVSKDLECRGRIPWVHGGAHYAGGLRNATMQTQARYHQFGRDGSVRQLLWGDANLAHWEEAHVCFGIAAHTSAAINLAIRASAPADPIRAVECAGPVSCNAFPHAGTGIRFAKHLTRQTDKPVPITPKTRKGEERQKPFPDGHEHLLGHAWDCVFDWWYMLDINNPWIFASVEHFHIYNGGGLGNIGEDYNSLAARQRVPVRTHGPR